MFRQIQLLSSGWIFYIRLFLSKSYYTLYLHLSTKERGVIFDFEFSDQIVIFLSYIA